MPTRVFVDANVLFSRTQRDWLYHLRQATGGGMFTVHSSEDVIAETLYRYRHRYPQVDGAVIANLRTAIEAIQDETIRDYKIDPNFPLADPDDLHVHAAAMQGQAHILLTQDAGWESLPKDLLDALPYEVYRPDDFFTLVDSSESHASHHAIEGQLKYWLGRQPDGVELVPTLRKADCPQFAERVQAHLTRRAMSSSRPRISR